MKVLIVDDEPLARSRIRRLLASHEGFNCVGEAVNGMQALELAQQLQPELVMLDIEMPGMSGLEVAATLSRSTPPPAIIFLTAHPEHALDAYQVGPSDYLLKPVSEDRLAQALQRLSVRNRAQLEASREQQEWISYQIGGALRRVPFSTLIACQADGKYVRLVFDSGEALIEKSLKQLEEEYGESLLRVHRNALVNRSRLESLVTLSGCHIVKMRGTTLQFDVSRRHVSEVKGVLISSPSP
ncbi:LytR/AlgR family response regulator transcription factor [Nitrincola alkalilacustris]|uniref:LytR/AlgR family response regulator transcription factor n=1 Tax=Nitrincola alkalilacustris TaxID=1571224 RepID=UPI00124F05F4|nr:LytTR family DNA-binding domain-containing protein [Nitrincola alkalilacustris]